jgi:hypothetical protein
MTRLASTNTTQSLVTKLRAAIQTEFGDAARPIDAVLEELDRRAEDIDSSEGETRKQQLVELTPLLDRVEDSLDMLRPGG